MDMYTEAVLSMGIYKHAVIPFLELEKLFESITVIHEDNKALAEGGTTCLFPSTVCFHSFIVTASSNFPCFRFHHFHQPATS